ncbi:restriction endonuclease subunit S [Microbacterium sp. KKR3/1]|uniref:restriction endonuclease subunit S n=1 Tax=Microbacterium sp. KKR3/1 TaxID=2904241 RepID=UPI001E466F76|nr:restriction endonuclease subunit S [Microbacterium sp. KKR3/1]MCE0509355.1 restriction endonuclease subunit S [Microbacterium sp. KKR3/1]
MSRIDELMAKLASGAVEYKRLGDIAELVRGNGMPKAVLTEEGVGAVHYGQIYTRYGAWATETVSYVLPETAVKLAKVDPGDLIITNTSENIDDVGKAVAWLGKRQIVTGGHATVIKHQLEPKYLAYWFASESFDRQKRKLSSGTKVIDVSAKQLEKVHIPVPPAEVQREIVRILDHFTDQFTELEAELEAEVEARRQQYAHYRDSLVAAVDGRAIAMGEIGTFIRGRRFTKNDVVDEGIPSIHYGEIYTDYGVSASRANQEVRSEMASQLRYAQPYDVIFAGVSETVEDVGKAVAWLGDGPVAVHDDTFSFTSKLDPMYVAYAVQTNDFHRQKANYVARGKVKRLSSAGLAKITIPVPSVAEQKRIVATLDSFDALVNKLSSELSAELAARRKQYEYYRDKLLAFPVAAS